MESDSVISEFSLSSMIERIGCDFMGWSGARIAQDDILWKPPLVKSVAYHQDSAYISKQFVPRENNSVTVWIALDDANELSVYVEMCP